MRTSKIISSIILWAVLAIAISCNHNSTEKQLNNLNLIKIKVAPVTRADIVDTLFFFGTVRMRQEARLASQFDGRLDDFSLLPGDRVKKGQRIGTIIPPAREVLLQILQNMPADVRSSLEQQIRSITLHSPIDGTVLDVRQHTGDVVDKGEEIIHIGDLTVLDIWGQLPLRYLPLARKAKKITIRFPEYPHPHFSLSVEAFIGKTEEATQTVVMRLRLVNPNEEFRPGMVAELSFPGQTRLNTLTIPREALLQEEGFYHVFVLEETHVWKRSVKVGLFDDDRVEIIYGVKEHEKVVIDKAYSLQDGMEVTAK